MYELILHGMVVKFRGDQIFVDFIRLFIHEVLYNKAEIMTMI